MTWLADPKTHKPLPAIPSREREIAYRARHWRPGWVSGFEYENGVPARMWFRQCTDSCCPPPEPLR